MLLLIQEFEKQQTTSSPDEKPRKRLPGLDVSIKRDEALAGSSGGSQCRLSVDAEIQEILKSSSESNTKQDQKLKYQCFQDNDVLVQVLMDESESRSVESDTQTDAIFSSSMLSRDRSFYSEKPEKKREQYRNQCSKSGRKALSKHWTVLSNGNGFLEKLWVTTMRFQRFCPFHKKCMIPTFSSMTICLIIMMSSCFTGHM